MKALKILSKIVLSILSGFVGFHLLLPFTERYMDMPGRSFTGRIPTTQGFPLTYADWGHMDYQLSRPNFIIYLIDVLFWILVVYVLISLPGWYKKRKRGSIKNNMKSTP